MKWKDEIAAKELLKRNKSIQNKIDNYEKKINELELLSNSIDELLRKKLIIEFGATYILDTLICDNLNNITKYAYEYGCRNWNGNKLIVYPYETEEHSRNICKFQLDYLKKVFE